MTIYAAPGQPDSPVEYKSRYDHYIGGEWVPPAKGGDFENPTPVTGENFTEIARGTADDVELALDAAHGAAPGWGRTSAGDRANILNKIADRIEDNLELLAVAETWDNGKAVRETLAADMPLTIDHFRYFAGALRAYRGVNETISTLLLNYIAIALLNHIVEGPLRDPASLNKPSTLPIGDDNMMGNLPGLDVHWGLAFGVGACLVTWVLMNRTTFGFAARMVGGNVRAALLNGLPVGQLIVIATFIGGACAGLAGSIEVAAIHGTAFGGGEKTTEPATRFSSGASGNSSRVGLRSATVT